MTALICLALLALCGAVNVQEAGKRRSDAEVRADGSVRSAAMMRRQRDGELNDEADDPPETTTIFEEGVNSSLLKLQEKRTVESKSAKDAGDPDESEDEEEEETTTTEAMEDDGDGLPNGDMLMSERQLAANASIAKKEAADDENERDETEPSHDETEPSGDETESDEAEKETVDDSTAEEEESADSTSADSTETDSELDEEDTVAELSSFKDGKPKDAAKSSAKTSAGSHSSHPSSAKSEHHASAKKSKGSSNQAQKGKPAVHHHSQKSASLVSEAELQAAGTTLTTTYYFTLVSSNKFCANANSGYKKNVGNYQTKACFEYVLNDASCGKYFDFGVVDGACDCVPKEQTNCKEADAENYHVYLVQKGGPEALVQVDDQGMAVQANGDPLEHHEASDD
eukprot:CAMPEP_0181454058 /NCGR_PEP_ID=MMETSP1110-20121109/30042_1 /TAXON_ID=174948 /ORGANISM="Symbiodinium sp., Strain CCMP421" /LENGTH=398 /DNA_ID=CAMNT_0023578391 /DNA_START=86 /DNA_END=1282 /DNA_ORIENTATION=-